LRLDKGFAGELSNEALVLLPIGQMPEALIIPSIMLRRGQNGMNAYELIVRLDATAKEKESSLPLESSTRVFGAKVHRGPNEPLSRH